MQIISLARWRRLGMALPWSCILVLVALAYAQQSPVAPLAPTLAPGNQALSTEPVYRSATVLKYTTRLILVDVIATDHKGEPLPDLKAEDFVLSEDGTKQDIRVFEFQSSAKTTSAPDKTLPKLAPNVVTNAPRYNVTRTLNVLLLDALNTRINNQAYAKDQMLKYLDKLPPDEPVAVYALGSKLRLLQDFTSDPEVLRKAILNAKGQFSPLRDKPAGSGPSVEQNIAGTLMENMPQQMQDRIKEFQQDNTVMQADFRLRLSLAALNSLARTLAGYPGRKNLIWLSESFPLAVLPKTIYPQSGETGVNNAPNQGIGGRDYMSDVVRTASLLTDAQVAVYPVDVRALVGEEFYSSLRNTSDLNGDYLGRVTTGRSGGASNVERRGAIQEELNLTGNELHDSHTTMNELADRTGGRAFYNRNEVDTAIRRTIDDGSNYYTLGYYPANKDWNGKFRKISVKSQRAGVKLRYRLGYFAIDPQSYSKMDPAQRNAEFGQALSLDFPAATALVFQARLFLPSAETKNKLLVRFAIDPHQISFEDKDGLQSAQVDCAVAVFSARGDSIKAEGGTSAAKLTPDQFADVVRKFYPCQIQTDLPAGQYILRLGVRDNRTGLIGSANASVTIPAATP